MEKHIPRCPSYKMIERIIKILHKRGEIHTSGGGCIPDPEVVRKVWYKDINEI